jgi:protein-tyrosine phosphatase
MSPQNSPTPDRLLPVTSVRNARDVGGYRTSSGETIRWRTLVRTAKLFDLDDNDRAYLADDLGLRTVIDLRTAGEIAAEPDMLGDLDVADFNFTPLTDLGTWIPGTMADLYLYTVDEHGEQYAGAIRELARPGALPALVHCTAGKDRTGVLIALVLDLLGVDDDVIIEDYMLSNVCLGLGEENIGASTYATIFPDWLETTLTHVRKTHGSVEQFLRFHGLGDEEFDALRTGLLERA